MGLSKILIVKMGGTFEHLRASRGDYERWFVECGGLSAGQVQVVRACEGETLPQDVHGFCGVIVTGAAAMVTDREDWSEATGRFLLSALGSDIPVLGVCYGHQLLADVLGGEVGDNPAGRQVGSARVELTGDARADALFSGMPNPMDVQVSHLQSVLSLPPHAVLLGRTSGDGRHIFRHGRCAWGVQFHPEFDHEIVPHYIRERSEAIRREGLDPDGLLTGVTASNHGERLLRRFVSICWSRGQG